MAEACNRDDFLEAGIFNHVEEAQTSTSRASIGGGGFQRKQCYMFHPKAPKKLFEDDDDEEEEDRVSNYHQHDLHHFLESCFLCERRFDRDDDIFMYKGEMAFCSEECREQHMEMDELKERRMRRRMKKPSTIKKVSIENRSSSSSHSKSIVVA